MQLLHDETRDAVNALIDTLLSSAGASKLGASAPSGLSGSNVQAIIDELAAAISELAGGVNIDGSTLTELVAAALENDILGDYYSGSQVDSLIAALGVPTLSSRLSTIENTLSADGVAVGEVVCEYPFTLPGAELAGFSSTIYTDKNRLFLNNKLIGFKIFQNETNIESIDVLTGEHKQIPLTGQIFSYSNLSTSEYTVRWIDKNGEYLILQFSNAYYFVSLISGRCLKLCSGSDYGYRGTIRLGGLICSMFHRSSTLYFYRLDVSSDSAASPLITSMDTYSETGSGDDRMLGSYGGDTLFVFKKFSTNCKIKAFKPAVMSSSVEYSTGLNNASIYGNVILQGDSCYFIINLNNTYRLAKCSVSSQSGSPVPSITVGETDFGITSIICRKDSSIYCARDTTLTVLNADTLEPEQTATLPTSISASLIPTSGSDFAPLWGGKYLPIGEYLFDTETLKSRHIRCDGETPAGYAIQSLAGRRLLCYRDSRWYMLDSMLRPVWGMVPYLPAGNNNF